jgi:acetolactate synthase-1/2/3 large subunit
MKMRLADYVLKRLVELGIERAFLVTGGGAMHLNDAIGRNKSIRWIACHHEQACSMAAEAYYRIRHKPALVNVTTGPGGTNAITGVYGAYVDSMGMIVVSGQVRYDTTVQSTGLPLRQMGDQEIDIVTMVKGITKYAVMVTDPMSIRYHIERAFHLATTGRPGPVWLDIPMNVQGTMIDIDHLRSYDPQEDAFSLPQTSLEPMVDCVWEKIQTAKRPVLLLGNGVRIAGAQEQALRIAEKLNIPLVTAWNAHDLVPNEHPTYIGRPNTVGDRAGNFAVQNADLLISIGCRLNIRQVGYNFASWAREAFRVIVDIDSIELQKHSIRPHLPIHADAKKFLTSLEKYIPDHYQPQHQDYLQWCLERRTKYPVVQPEYTLKPSPINPYVFIDTLTRLFSENEVMVTGDGTACVVTFQAAMIKSGQRLFTNSGCASMGFDLPAALGAAAALKDENKIQSVYCFAGDGSIMMNLQELATIVGYALPIKIVLLNNGGYHSIRQTQQNYFSDSFIGFDKQSGVHLPSFEKIANAFGLKYFSVQSHDGLERNLREWIADDSISLLEVFVDETQGFAPKASAKRLEDGRMVSAPLEDLAPFLDRNEYRNNLLIEEWK